MHEYKGTIPSLSLKRENTGIRKVKICTSRDAADFMRSFYGDDLEVYESFYLVTLNRSNTTTNMVKISQGGTCGTVVDVTMIAKYAIDGLASNVLLAHNHPSGNVNPSTQDIDITNKVVNALKLFGINVLDHVILTAESFYSFADNGNL